MPLPQKRADLLKTNPLIEITLLHRAMRLELEAMCAAARALAASAADEAPALANLRRRFRAFAFGRLAERTTPAAASAARLSERAGAEGAA